MIERLQLPPKILMIVLKNRVPRPDSVNRLLSLPTCRLGANGWPPLGTEFTSGELTHAFGS